MGIPKGGGKRVGHINPFGSEKLKTIHGKINALWIYDPLTKKK